MQSFRLTRLLWAVPLFLLATSTGNAQAPRPAVRLAPTGTVIEISEELPPIDQEHWKRDAEAMPASAAGAGQIEGIRTRDGRIVRAGWGLPVVAGETLEFDLMEPEKIPTADSASSQLPMPARGSGLLDWRDSIEWNLPGGALTRLADGSFRLFAPTEPGNVPLKLISRSTVTQGAQNLVPPTERTLDLWVMTGSKLDSSGSGVIEGIAMGVYPNEEGRGAPQMVSDNPQLYRPPSAFYKVTPETVNIRISEHYTLGDFASPLVEGTQFIAIDPRLIDFLEEASLQLPSRFGSAAEGTPLKILIAFISPHQLDLLVNQGITFAEFTRYQYGDGAAVIWDLNGDDRMDDLNADGQVDIADGQMLADALIELQKELRKFGGIGAATRHKIPTLPDTPYVDVDMRGVSSRW